MQCIGHQFQIWWEEKWTMWSRTLHSLPSGLALHHLENQTAVMITAKLAALRRSTVSEINNAEDSSYWVCDWLLSKRPLSSKGTNSFALHDTMKECLDLCWAPTLKYITLIQKYYHYIFFNNNGFKYQVSTQPFPYLIFTYWSPMAGECVTS